MRLLIIEDNAVEQDALRGLFAASEDIDMRLTGSLAGADLEIEEAEFVVLDLTLPDATPETALAWLQEARKPAIVLSATSDKDTIRLAAESGAFAFLTKNSVADQIVTAIHFALAKEDLMFEKSEQRSSACRVLAERIRLSLPRRCDCDADTDCHNEFY